MAPIPRQRRPIPSLLRLPLELRQQIYAYLLPHENVSHPLPSVGIASVSHRPPSASLLNIHPHLTDEILSYFYQISTWKLVFSHAFNFFRVDPDLRRLEQSPSLAQIRKVEVVFFCDLLLLHNYPSFGLESFVAEIRRRAKRACDVLAGAGKLREVRVSWCDTTTNTGSWEEKAGVLMPLKELERKKPGIKFKVGKISAEDVDRETFGKALQNVLGPEQRLETGYDGAADEASSKLRMLAFDVRQERLQSSTTPGGYPIAGLRRTGWRGAPPALETAVEENSDADEG